MNHTPANTAVRRGRTGRTAFWVVAALVLCGIIVTVALVIQKKSRDTSHLPHLGDVPPFSLTAQSGEQSGDAMMRGKISIVDFIFTSCTSICPVMSGRMAYMQGILGTLPEMQFISISVDPETDTPGVLTDYATRYGAIPGKWYFLTGGREAIYTLTREGFHLGLDTEGLDVIIHSQKFILVDDSLRIRGYYDSDDNEEMDQLIGDAELLTAQIRQ